MIRRIQSKAHMVEIVADEGTSLISRKEALYRAKAIIGMDKISMWLVEGLVKAANEAKIYEDGTPYKSDSLDLLLNVAQKEANKQPA
jgi:hypothetical protein